MAVGSEDRLLKFVRPAWLSEKSKHAGLIDGVCGDRLVRIPGEQDEHGIGVFTSDRGDQAQPARAGHVLVGDDDREWAVGVDACQRLSGRGRGGHIESSNQPTGEGFDQRPLVVDDEHLRTFIVEAPHGHRLLSDAPWPLGPGSAAVAGVIATVDSARTASGSGVGSPGSMPDAGGFAWRGHDDSPTHRHRNGVTNPVGSARLRRRFRPRLACRRRRGTPRILLR